MTSASREDIKQRRSVSTLHFDALLDWSTSMPSSKSDLVGQRLLRSSPGSTPTLPAAAPPLV